MLRRIGICLCLCLGALYATLAQASLVITGTRVVFEEQRAETVVQMSNVGSVPLLIQIWMDAGDPSASPDQVDVPFTLTPPIVRIEANKGQAIRILKSHDELPKDRESLYWLNALEVPPKDSENSQFMQFAFRTRIKFFYRPAGLAIPLPQAYERLQFQLEKAGDQFAVRVKNPSPYYVTFRSFKLRQSSTSDVLADLEPKQERMVSPEGELLLRLNSSLGEIPSGARIFFSVVNDYGGENQAERALLRSSAP